MSDSILPAPTSVTARALRAFRRLGPLAFARLLAFNLKLLITGRYKDYVDPYDRSFDIKYGVDTSGTVAVEDLEFSIELQERAVRYEPADPGFFNFLIDRLGQRQRAELLFIDVGSGKGRVMLLAALAGFRRVVGLELDRRLANIASRNIERFSSQHPGTDFTVVAGDATSFSFPPVPTVLFLNNPFDGQLIEKMLDNLERAHRNAASDVTLLYMHSMHAELIRRRDGWTELDQGVFETRRQIYSILHR